MIEILVRGGLFFVYFFLANQKKVNATPAARAGKRYISVYLETSKY
jgi:hypothetical protein